MFKGSKFRVIISVVILVCLMTMPSFAADLSPSESLALQKIQAYEKKLMSTSDLYAKCEKGSLSAEETKIHVTSQEGIAEVTAYKLSEKVSVNAAESLVSEAVVFRVPNYVITGTDQSIGTVWNPGRSIEGTLVITYELANYNGAEIKRMKTVSGNYNIMDTSFSVTDQTVMYGQTGMGPDSLIVNEVVDESNPKKPTSSSWSYNTGFSGFLGEGGAIYQGGTYLLDIQRQSYTYRIEVTA